MDYKALFLSRDGRINRQPFWIGLIILNVIGLIIQGIVLGTGVAEIFYLQLLLIWPNIAIGVKRCHDRNRSGWFLLLSIIPVLNIWVLIELGFLAGTEGDNNYGGNPLPAT